VADEILVLGAGFLGVNVALQSDGDVTLIDQDLQHEYIPGVIDLIRDRRRREDLQVDLEKLLPDTKLTEDTVVAIRPEEKVVETKKGLYGYEKLVIGLGGKPRTFGMDISEAHTVWGTEDTERLVEDLEDTKKALVVGSGYTGLEVAGEIAEREIETVVVETRTRPAPNLSERSSEKFLELMQKKGVSFRGGVKVQKITEEGVETEDGEIEADTVVWCGGVQASEVVQKSFDVDGRGVKVNRGFSVENHEDIFAGGDCADSDSLKTAHNAMTQADTIAENLERDKHLKQFGSDSSPIAVSFGDTGAVVHNQEVVWTGFPSRVLKDLVRRYYFLRLKWRKLM
jgi:NADH dehydrogenase